MIRECNEPIISLLTKVITDAGLYYAVRQSGLGDYVDMIDILACPQDNTSRYSHWFGIALINDNKISLGARDALRNLVGSPELTISDPNLTSKFREWLITISSQSNAARI